MATAKSSSKLILSDNDGNKSVSLPNQRVSRNRKNQASWQKDTIDFFIDNRTQQDESRKSRSEMLANWDFYNNVLSTEAMNKTFDPMGVESSIDSPESLAFEFYNILDQPLDTLFGEELKRTSDVKAYAINPHIINDKDLEFRESVKQFLSGIVDSVDPADEKAVKERLKQFDKFKKNDLQSAHEKMSNNILQVLTNDSRLNLKLKHNQGFKNLQINAEEIFRVGHTGKELAFDVVDSANFYVLGQGTSPYVSDGYAWIESTSLNAHKIIEEFADELTDSEVDDILSTSRGDEDSMRPQKISLVERDSDSPHQTTALPIIRDKDFLYIDGDGSEDVDAEGNIKLYRIQWLALRKLGKLKYYDTFGDAQFKWVDEGYKADITQGEEIEWIWVNELWEGTRIKSDIYKRVRPCPVQMRSKVNPAIVRPSYIGYVLSNNGKVQKSRIEKLKPYQNMYNLWANKLVKLWAQHIGKVGVIDIAKIPSNMETEEWYLWVKRFNIMFENSFEEGKHGAAKGQIAGHMQQNVKQLDLGLAEDINQAIQTLSWIEDRVNKISAVPESRQGATSGREGLGVTQQSIVQSSHQTEVDFAIHDLIKSHCYEIMIEYIKVLWKDEKGKRQYLLDDLSSMILDIDGELLNEAEFGIAITNSSQLNNMYNNIQQLTHAAMQTGTATLSDIAQMLMASSPSQMVSQLKEAEDKRIEQQNEQARMQQEGAQAQMEAAKELELIKHQQELEKIDKEWQYKLQAEQLKVSAKIQEHSTDTNQNHIEDAVELEKEQIKATSAEKMQSDKLTHDEKLKQMEIKSKEKIEAMKEAKKKKSE